MDQNDRIKEMRTAMNARLLLLMAGLFLVVNAVTSTGRTGLSWMGLMQLVEEYQETGTISGVSELSVQDVRDTSEAEEDAAAADKKTEAGEAEVPAADTKTEADDAEASSSDTEQEPETELTAEEQAKQDMETLLSNMDELGVTVNDFRLLGIFSLIVAFVEAVVGIICAVLSNRVDKYKITLTSVIVLLATEICFMILLYTKRALALSMLINCVILPLILLWSALKMRKLAKADPERKYAVARQEGYERKPAPQPAPKKSLRERAMMDTRLEPEAATPGETDSKEKAEPATEAEKTDIGGDSC